jgi:hypothetical protein
MNFRNSQILLKLFSATTKSTIKRNNHNYKFVINYLPPWVYIIYCALIIYSNICVGWNGSNLTILNVVVEDYGGSSREIVLSNYWYEIFSCSWLFIAISILPNYLLLPLVESFSISQILWLRFTPCLSSEIALAKVFWVISWGLWINVLTVIWAVIYSIFHHIILADVFLHIVGLFGHVVFSGGIIVVLDFLLREDHRYRITISTVALLLPLVISFVHFSQIIKDDKYLPFVIPFTNASENMSNFISAAITGTILLLIFWIKDLMNDILSENFE